MDIKVIAFDADDTLWVNETYFRETEVAFCQLLEAYLPQHDTERELMKTVLQNLPLYGYGIKGFMLSMIETAFSITQGTHPHNLVNQILDLGKQLLARPIELLEGIEEVLGALKEKYRLVVATKGDLLDQERKLKKSGIEHYFHHIEIMSEKAEPEYRKLLKHLDIQPQEFLMIGNSLKSDVLPVINLGGHAIHIPFHITWAHEMIDHQIEHPNFKSVVHAKEVLPFLLP